MAARALQGMPDVLGLSWGNSHKARRANAQKTASGPHSPWLIPWPIYLGSDPWKYGRSSARPARGLPVYHGLGDPVASCADMVFLKTIDLKLQVFPAGLGEPSYLGSWVRQRRHRFASSDVKKTSGTEVREHPPSTSIGCKLSLNVHYPDARRNTNKKNQTEVSATK